MLSKKRLVFRSWLIILIIIIGGVVVYRCVSDRDLLTLPAAIVATFTSTGDNMALKVEKKII